MAKQSLFPLLIPIIAKDKASSVIGRVSRNIRKIAGGSRILGGRLLGAAQSAGTLTAGLLGVSAAVSGASLVSFARSFADEGDNVAKTATRLGFSAQALQEWRFAAERSGIAASTFDMATQRLGRRMADAAGGTGEALGAIEHLGIALKDSNGNLRSLDSVLPELAQKLGSIENASLRNALAMRLLDSEGVELNQMFVEGEEGLAKLRAEAHKVGAVMSQESVDGAVRLSDANTNLVHSLKSIRNIGILPLIPFIEELSQKMQAWVNDNRPKIKAWSEEFAAKLPGRLAKLRDFFGELADMMAPLIDGAKWVVEHFGAANTVMGLLAITATAKVGPGLLDVALGLKEVGGGILGLTGMDQKLKAFFAMMFAGLKGGGSKEKLGGALFDAYGASVGKASVKTSKLSRLKGFLMGAGSKLMKVIKPLGLLLGGIFSPPILIGGAVVGLLALLEAKTGLLSKAAKAMGAAIKSAFGKMVEWAKKFFDALSRPAELFNKLFGRTGSAPSVQQTFPGGGSNDDLVSSIALQGAASKADINVNIGNAPPGSSVSTTSDDANLNVYMGYAIGAA